MYNYKGSNEVAQLGSAPGLGPGVAGSNPVFPTIYKNWGHLSSFGESTCLARRGSAVRSPWLPPINFNKFQYWRRDSSVG